MSQIMRVIPLLIAGVGITKGSTIFMDLMGGSFKTNTAREIDSIAKHIRADIITGERAPAPDQLAAYIEKNFTLEKKAKKGLTFDYWGSPYRLETGDAEVRVVSAGPDKIFGNGDDIMAKVDNLGADQMPLITPPPNEGVVPEPTPPDPNPAAPTESPAPATS